MSQSGEHINLGPVTRVLGWQFCLLNGFSGQISDARESDGVGG